MLSVNAKKPVAVVLSGDGLNCEIETAKICEEVGFSAKIEHVNDFIMRGSLSFSELQFLIIPGGFSFGDELGSGKLLALKILHYLGDSLKTYIRQGGGVLGICNGFQALTHLGVFDEELKGKVALTHNQSGRFMNRWVSLNVVGKSPYVKSIAKMELPIRHGEGRLVFENESIAASAFESGKCVMQYSENVNGAWNEIAALAVNEGRVMGMMPHPEAFWCNELHPTGNASKGPLGTEIFRNAYECFK